MSKLLEFFNDMRDNGYGLAEIAAQLGTSAIAEPVAGFAAMYDPANGADAIREGMTYQPRSEAAKMYQQGASNVVGQAIKPVMPVIDAWQKGVDIAGKYSPSFGALLKTVPTAIGVTLGAKPALQTGRNMSEGLGAMQARMIANANAPRTLNTGYMGQRGAINVLNSVNPTGSVFVDYNPNHRANAPLAKNIVSYDKTSGGSPDEMVTIYRGLPKNQKNINSGDFVTTNSRLAQDYAGDGHVIKMTVKKSELLDDINEPLGEEYIYRKPQRPLTEFEQAHLTAQRNAALPVNQGGLGLAPDNTAMDRARAMGFDVDTTYTHRSRTPNYIQEINPKGEYSGLFSLANDDAGVNYGNNKHEFLLKGDIATNIADEYSDALLKKNLKEIVGHKSSTKISSNDMDTIRYALDNQTMFMNEPDRLYELFNSFDDVDSFVAIQKTLGELSRKKGYGAVKMEDEFGDSTMLLYGNKVRYKDAAFDPKKAKSANLLAQYGAIAPTTALGAYMYNEKRKKSQGNQ